MAAPMQASFPQAVLASGMQVVFEAVDPTTGLAVSGVVISEIGMLVEGLHAGAGDFAAGVYMLVPGPDA